MLKPPIARKSGYVLPLVAMLLLALTLLFTALLHVPGNIRRYANRAAATLQNIYDAESAIMLHLRGIPASAIPALPSVNEESLGPFKRLCATSESSLAFGVTVCATAVSRFERLSYGEWLSGIGEYKSRLRNTILSRPDLRRYSGNHRFFKPPPHANILVQDGDLTLDFGGNVEFFNAFVTGDVNVSGTAEFDTLRLFALGNITLKGNVRTAFMEVVAGGDIEIKGNVLFRGIAVSEHGIEMSRSVQVVYPGMAIAMEHLKDYTDSIMPAFWDGKLEVFESGMLE